MVFTITKTIGTIGAPSMAGWTKEINMVSWNGRAAKYDIRDWSPDHDKMGKGITLTETEAKDLVNVLSAYLSDKGDK